MIPKEDLRIVFLGTPEFAVESLDAIVSAGYNVVAAVTMPDKPAGRGHRMFESPVKLAAMRHGIPVLQPVRLKDEAFIEQLRALNANLFVVIAFRMLPEVVWKMPRYGTFNLHASLLPRYRGAAPINRAVMNGDTVTGVTTFFLKHEIDTGDIIDQEKIEIGPDDNVGDVHDRLMHLGARLTLRTIDDLCAGTLTTIPQERLIGDTLPTPAPKIFKEDCRIDWTRPAEAVRNHVRGLSPYPTAWSALRDGDTLIGDVKIYEVRHADTTGLTLAPGEVAICDGRMYAGTADTPLEIISLQIPGKRRLTTAEYLRGSRLESPHFEP